MPTYDGRVLIVVGDVAGHGITAIKEMTRLRGKIMGAALHKTDPGEILTEANRQLIRIAGNDPILGTVLCAFIDPATREISYAGPDIRRPSWRILIRAPDSWHRTV